MAIHPGFPGLKAEVVVDGQALREYDDDQEPQAINVVKYVEVSSDAHFGVRYTLPKGLTGEWGLKAILRIDGTGVGGWNHSRKLIDRKNVTNVLYSTTDIIDGSIYSQKFCFTQLSIGKLLTPQVRLL